MRTLSRGLLAASLTLATLPGLAATIPFERYTLPNGLTVVLHEDHGLPQVVVDVDYHVGSKNEEVGRTGFAHLFEHLMFEGSKNAQEPYDHYTEPAGASNNAFTTEDHTNYYLQLPSHQLELGLWLESDRMGYFGSVLKESKFLAQRDVVKNEKRQRFDNEPYGSRYEEMLKRLWIDHPYRWPVIGSMADLDAAKLPDVKAFFDRYYAPNNATLVIAGDFNKVQAKSWVQRYFGDLERGPEIDRPFSSDKPLTKEMTATLVGSVQLPGVFVTYRAAKMGDGDAFPLDLLANVLGGGHSSRLYRKLVTEKRLAQSVEVSHWSQEHGGLFQIEAIAAPNVTPAKLQAAIDEEMTAVRHDMVSNRELEKAINQTIAAQLFARERLLDRAQALAASETFFKDPGMVARQETVYRGQSRADLLRVAKQYLNPNARVVLTYIQGDETK
ncbi:MAG: insulinase family protein [Candidatus Sericytochromatia bacterium]|nr:insulinase family protein [Candidatus Sericytochromatia bacterium]